MFFARLAGRVAPWQFGLRPTRPGPAIGIVALGYVAFIAFSAAWVALLNIHDKDELPKELGVDTSHVALAATAVLVCVIAPVAEEFIFRGYIFPRAAQLEGAVARRRSSTGSSSGRSTPARRRCGYLVPLALFGSVLCLVYVRTRLAVSLHRAPRPEQLDRLRRGRRLGLAGAAGLRGRRCCDRRGALGVRRVFGPAPPLPSPV